MTGNDHRRRLGEDSPHSPQEIQAVHVRHHEVDEQDLHRLALQQGQRLLTAAGQPCPHAFSLEDVVQERAGIRIIVDDQHPSV